jgi:hypothetical protein
MLPALLPVELEDAVRDILPVLVTVVANVEGLLGDSESDAESQASSSAHDASIYEPKVELVLLLKWVDVGCRIPSMLLCCRAGGEKGGAMEHGGRSARSGVWTPLVAVCSRYLGNCFWRSKRGGCSCI